MERTRIKIWLSLLACITLALGLRLLNLTDFPIFNDEILYILRAEATLAGDYFIGARIGREGIKQLYIWLLAILLPIIQSDLLAARLISAIAGGVSSLLCYAIASKLYPQQQLGLWAALFYALLPFTLFHDRLGLMDSLLTLLMGASLLTTVYLWRQATVWRAILVGVMLGLATLTKIYSLLFYPLPLLMWLWLGRQGLSWRDIIGYLIVVYSSTMMILSPLVLVAPAVYAQLAAKYGQPTTPTQPTSDPIWLTQFWQNLAQQVNWLTVYLTWPLLGLLGLSLIGMLAGLAKLSVAPADGYRRVDSLLWGLVLLFGLFFALVFALSSAAWYPRYLLPTAIPLAILLTRALSQMSHLLTSSAAQFGWTWLQSANGKFLLTACGFALLMIPAAQFNYTLLTDPPQLPIPSVDRWQYLEGLHAGYGLPAAAETVHNLADDYAHVTLVGNIHASDLVGLKLHFEDRFPDDQRVTFRLFRNIDSDLFQQLCEFAQDGPVLTVRTEIIAQPEPTFTVLGQPIPPQVIQPLGKFSKPAGHIDIVLYQYNCLL